MNSMNMPGFTADHSLYGTNGHYRSDRNRTGLKLPAQANSTIHPEATDLDTVGEEVIIVEGTAPWGLPSGWGPGGWGGPHGGGGPIPTGPGSGSGSGGGGRDTPKPPPKPKGEDKKGERCERVEKNGSSTYGKCERPTVCKGKEVTKNRVTGLWTCKA